MRALVALVAGSALLRAWAGTKVPGPWFIPDEVVYAELGRSLYSLGHFRILGATPDFFGAVYPAFAGLPLHAAGISRGYAILKPLQGVAMSLAAVPVYLWGRTLVSRGWALAAAALTLCVPELGLSAFVLTEVLFYPVFCLTAWLMARALLRPALGRQALVWGAIFLAAMTRLQAVVLAPAFLLAGLIYFGPRGARRLLPTLAALGVAAVAWFGVTLASGGHVLGAYAVTTGRGYDVLEAVRFVVYHAADLVLVTGVVSAVALTALATAVFRERERSPEVRAFVAVTLAVLVAFVPLVGVYASRFTGRLAERNLIVLAPLLFLALVAWLGRDAPRHVAALAGSAGAIVLLAVTPWHRFVVPAAEPDAFSLVPLVELRHRLAPVAVVLIVAAVLLALLLALPRRLLPLVPVALGVLLAAGSVSAARLAARQARGYELTMAGDDPRWIDKHAPGPVLFIYGGEHGWSGGGPVWASVFWNERVAQVDELFGSHVVGPIPASSAQIASDRRIVVKGDRRPALRYAVAPRRVKLAGTPIWGSRELLLWQVDPPLRVAG